MPRTPSGTQVRSQFLPSTGARLHRIDGGPSSPRSSKCCSTGPHALGGPHHLQALLATSFGGLFSFQGFYSFSCLFLGYILVISPYHTTNIRAFPVRCFLTPPYCSWERTVSVCICFCPPTPPFFLLHFLPASFLFSLLPYTPTCYLFEGLYIWNIWRAIYFQGS